jgi:O-acetyl-ADP-ribose deacetylase (regulator of RNase III)
MIEYVKGDLLKSGLPLIAHGCNMQGVMGSGIALQIKLKYTYAFVEYKKAILRGAALGDIIPSYSEFNPIIINCLTQQYYGKDGKVYISYDAIKSCFNKLSDYCLEYGVEEMGMPKIGAGLGGGDWNRIENILKNSIKILNNTKVYVYEL